MVVEWDSPVIPIALFLHWWQLTNADGIKILKDVKA